MISSTKKHLTDAQYWQIIAEIDYLYYTLEEHKRLIVGRDPWTQQIDKATGFDKKLFREGKSLVRQIQRRQAKLPDDDPHFLGAVDE